MTTTQTQEPNMTATQTRREVEIDTQLGELWGQISQIGSQLESNRISLAHKLRIRAEYHGRSKTPYYPAFAELEKLAQGKLRSGELAEWDALQLRKALGDHDTLTAQREALRTAAEPLEAEYNAAPWSRFFLVNNTGGHIHSTMSCSTCHITTSFSWLPELSGLSEKDAVDAHGAILCTVCFPSAPTEWTNQYELEAEAKAAAKAATQCSGSGTWNHDSSGLQYASPRARCNVCGQTVSVTSTGKLRGHKPPETAAQAAEKAAQDPKAITAPDGSPLKDFYGSTIKTLVSAKRELSNALQNEALSYGTKWSAYAERLAQAIAAKTGEAADDLIETGQQKAAKTVAKWAN